MKKTKHANSVRLLFLLTISICSLGCSKADRSSGQSNAEKERQSVQRAATKVERKYDGLAAFLDDDEQARLLVIHQEHQSLLKTWHTEHGKKIRSGQSAVVDFMKTKNKAKAREAIAQGKRDNVKELILEEREMQKKYESAVVAAIPVEKLKQWQADHISRTLLAFLEPLDLTEAQVKQVYELAPAAIQQVREKDKEAWRLIGTDKLEKLFGQRIITHEQKQPFEELKEKNKRRKLKWAF